MSELSAHILECMESGCGWGMVPSTAHVPRTAQAFSDLDLVGGQFGCPTDGVVEVVFPSVT